MSNTFIAIFKHCVEAINQGVLIKRVSSSDKEFHFQNWFQDRLKETGFNFEIGGRNSYPDFRIVKATDGYELIGYSFDLKTNEIIPKKVLNPGAGREHIFRAWRIKGAPSMAVSLRPIEIVVAETDLTDEETDE